MENTTNNSNEKLKLEILENIKKHVPSWKSIISHDMIHLTRMSGLSNACYRVMIQPNVDDDNIMQEL